MNTRTILALPLVLGGLHAQTQAPDSYFATREGDTAIPYVFTQPSRFQQIHSNLPAGPVLISAIRLRRDGIVAGGPHNPLASKNVTMTLVLAPSVAAGSATATFASNYAGAGATVFNGVLATPASWGTSADSAPTGLDLVIPVTPPYMHAGGPLLWDANSSATSTTTRIDLDAAQSGFSLYSWCSYQMQTPGCFTWHGAFELRGNGQNVGFPPGTIVSIRVRNGPPNFAAAWLIGFQSLGGPVPGLCAPLWVNPIASISGMVDPAGAWDAAFTFAPNPIWNDVPIEMQVVSVDPQQGPIQVALTNGLTYKIQALQPTFAVSSISAPTSAAATGTLNTARAAIVRFD